MRSIRRLTATRKAGNVALAVAAGAGALSLAVTSALAAPKGPAAPEQAPAVTTTTTVVDTTPPPAPVLAEKPDLTTTSRNAHFKFTDDEAGARFRCRLGDAPYGDCAPVVNFNNLDPDEHCVDVRAVDGAGNLSSVTTWCWSIVLHGGFPISGTVDGLFAPGVTHPINLVIGNPYNFGIRVTAVTITIADGTGREGCSGTANLTVTKGLTVPVDVPRNTTSSLRDLGVAQDDWPRLTMPNLPTNQDACKSATFSLTYTGQATKS